MSDGKHIIARNAMYGSKRSAAIQTASFVIEGQISHRRKNEVEID